MCLCCFSSSLPSFLAYPPLLSPSSPKSFLVCTHSSPSLRLSIARASVRPNLPFPWPPPLVSLPLIITHFIPQKPSTSVFHLVIHFPLKFPFFMSFFFQSLSQFHLSIFFYSWHVPLVLFYIFSFNILWDLNFVRVFLPIFHSSPLKLLFFFKTSWSPLDLLSTIYRLF